MKKATVIYGPSHKEIMSLLRNSEVFLCGSKKEQYPLMLCEAAALGLAIISTDVGHAKSLPGSEIVTDYEDMAVKINELSYYPEKLKANGQMLREYAKENYVIEDKTATFENLLEGLVNA